MKKKIPAASSHKATQRTNKTTTTALKGKKEKLPREVATLCVASHDRDIHNGLEPDQTPQKAASD